MKKRKSINEWAREEMNKNEVKWKKECEHRYVEHSKGKKIYCVHCGKTKTFK